MLNFKKKQNEETHFLSFFDTVKYHPCFSSLSHVQYGEHRNIFL